MLQYNTIQKNILLFWLLKIEIYLLFKSHAIIWLPNQSGLHKINQNVRKVRIFDNVNNRSTS